MKIMHSVRDGDFWDKAPAPEPTNETYDLVVVGGGISGLAAAFLYRQQVGDQAKILILENNDDFGGHARRNEFTASNGKMVIGYGGSQSLQSPSYFSPLVNKALDDVGIDIETFESWYDSNWHMDRGLGEAVFFPKEVFGEDKLVATSEVAEEWVGNTPLNDKAKRDLIELMDAPPDYLAGKTREQKFEILSTTTYADFLTRICGYDPQLLDYFQHSTEEYFGVGIDATTALDAWGNYDPGFDGMDLGDVPYKTMSPSGRLVLTDPDEYIHHFPDGNASVARAFVRAMIPAAQPGSSMEELVLQPVDYSKLDDPADPVRLRLNASVVRVKHDGPPETAQSVTLTYVEDGKLKTVQGSQVVLACWHRVIPHITDEVGETQIEALNNQVKVPLVYANVLIRNWEAFDALKISGFKAVEGLLEFRRDRLSGQRRQLQIRRQAGGPGAASYHQAADSRRRGNVGQRPVHRRPLCAARPDIRGDGARNPRHARPGAGRRRFRSGARHRGDHHQSLVAWLCTRIHAAMGCVLAGRAAAHRDLAQAVGPHRHRQFRRRRLCLCAFGDRPGGQGGQGTAGRQGRHACLRRLSRPATRSDRALTPARRERQAKSSRGCARSRPASARSCHK